jgi:hypothetical protein
MIVLVNDEQRRQLQEAEAQSDRFEREVESGQEQLTKPFNPLNAAGENSAAIPEPSTIGGVILAIVGLGGLTFAKQRQRKVI